MRSLIDKALQTILKMLKKKDERVLVWKNASPASEFKEQTVNVDLEGCDFYEIEYLEFAGGAYHYCTGRVPASNRTKITIATSRFWERQIMAVDASKIEFGGGRTIAAYNGSSAADNTAAVPYAIYKIISGGGQAS